MEPARPKPNIPVLIVCTFTPAVGRGVGREDAHVLVAWVGPGFCPAVCTSDVGEGGLRPAGQPLAQVWIWSRCVKFRMQCGRSRICEVSESPRRPTARVGRASDALGVDLNAEGGNACENRKRGRRTSLNCGRRGERNSSGPELSAKIRAAPPRAPRELRGRPMKEGPPLV